MKKFYYLGNISNCYGGASETVYEGTGSAWKNFKELSGVLVKKQSFTFEAMGEDLSVLC